MYIERSQFLLKEIPQFHRLSLDYRNFWSEQWTRNIEGFWSSGIWMPGRLYFYGNFGTIELSERNSKVRKLGRPRIRDTEWKVFRYWEEARGFSGFLDDPQYSCNRLLLFPDYYDNDALMNLCYDDEDRLMEDKLSNFFKEDGSRKEYTECRSYLQKVHSSNLGRPRS